MMPRRHQLSEHLGCAANYLFAGRSARLRAVPRRSLAPTDGVVILQSAFGNTGTAARPISISAALPLTVGHWLNLRHIWGDDGTDCTGDDFVTDTPPSAGPNIGKPTFPRHLQQWTERRLVLDYMDYVDDDTMFMFTNGQVLRMNLSRHRSQHDWSYQSSPRLSSLRTCLAPSLLPRLTSPPSLSRIPLPWPREISSQLQLHATFLQSLCIDLQTISFRDFQPTAFFRDVAGPGGPGPFGDPPSGGFGAGGGGRHVPFVLSTPHHTMSWRQSFPDIAQQQVEQIAAQLAEYEQLLSQYAEADASGSLSAVDSVRAEQMTAEYMAASSDQSADRRS